MEQTENREKKRADSSARRLMLFRALAIAWMVMIFCFSAADGQESSNTSHWAGMTLGRIFISDFEELTPEEQLEWAEKIDYPIRKCAHASEYAVLALLVFAAIGGAVDRGRFFFSFLITFFYACTDEFHQLFVPGRAGSFIDVMIDSAGAAAGLLILFGILKLISRRRRKKVAAGMSQS